MTTNQAAANGRLPTQQQLESMAHYIARRFPQTLEYAPFRALVERFEDRVITDPLKG